MSLKPSSVDTIGFRALLRLRDQTVQDTMELFFGLSLRLRTADQLVDQLASQLA